MPLADMSPFLPPVGPADNLPHRTNTIPAHNTYSPGPGTPRVHVSRHDAASQTPRRGPAADLPYVPCGNHVAPPESDWPTAAAAASSPPMRRPGTPMDDTSPFLRPVDPANNLPHRTNTRPVHNTHPPRPGTPRVRVSRHDAASRSPRRSRHTLRTSHRIAERRDSHSPIHTQHHCLNQCMFCNVCPQHQHLLDNLLSPPHSCSPAPIQAQHALCQHPSPSNLPFTPAQLMCISSFQPWMNSRVYVQRPFY